MTPPKKGIVDPWRVVDPIKPPPKPAATFTKKKINLNEIDFDADLRLPETMTLSSKHGTVMIKNTRISTANDGLRDLVQCLFQILELYDGPELFDRAAVGFKLADRVWLEPPPGVRAAAVSTAPGYMPETALWFHKTSYDSGMLQLIRLLNNVNRRTAKEGSDILKRWGVIPMVR
jgi:hypothetical protein